MTDKSRAFRDALGRYPTGVALVTAPADGRPRVMTVNSFASVSLDPPLILWSLARDTGRAGVFLNAEVFAVSVLAADQRELANACARNDDLVSSGAAWTTGALGAPLVDGAVARFECRRFAVYPGGDHDIILGEVAGFDAPRAAPSLVFHRSAYASADGARS